MRFLRALAANLLLLLALALIYTAIITAVVKWGAKPREHPPADVVFVFDTTGSMQDKIDGLLAISSRFAGRLAGAGIDCRLAMVAFGAVEEPRVIRDTFPPDVSVSAFKRFLHGTRAGGGGCEDQPTAVKHALSTFTYRPEARKIMILITDERLLGNESYGAGDIANATARQAEADWNGIIEELIDREFTVYAVCIPSEPFQRMADRTGGKFYDIVRRRDFTGIVMDIAKEIDASLTR
jgi:Mg-chelatase subunit ChlD